MSQSDLSLGFVERGESPGFPYLRAKSVCRLMGIDTSQASRVEAWLSLACRFKYSHGKSGTRVLLFHKDDVHRLIEKAES